jgi:hypothetical protein
LSDNAPGPIDDRVDQLYDLPPGEFTAARNALARALRGEDRREDADRVAKLRKPTIAAWAINQTVRHHRDRLDALLDAGAQVGRAQRRALSGVRRSGMREATRARRELIDELTDLAADLLTDAGSNPESHRSDIAATFDAASADEEAAGTVRAARLAAPLPVTSGFSGLEGLLVLPEPEPEPDPDGRPDTTVAAEEDVDAARERAAQRRREAIRTLEEARRALREAEDQARAAADAVSARSSEAEAAERAAEEAKEIWRRLQREAAARHEDVARAREHANTTRRQAERHGETVRERERELNDLDS